MNYSCRYLTSIFVLPILSNTKNIDIYLKIESRPSSIRMYTLQISKQLQTDINENTDIKPETCSHFWFRFMVFNATFNDISVISWRAVLLVEKTGVPGENYRPVASH